MLKKLLQKIENKYVFNISQYFWHIFVVLASLALIGGVLILLWGIIPPGKDDVKKQDYPVVVQVETNEVLAVLKKMEEKPTQTKTAPVKPTITETAQVTYTDPDEKNYNQSLDSLKKLIPVTKYSWSSSGYWYYPYGESYYRYYRDRGYDSERYRSWTVSETGINEKLEEVYSKSNATAFGQKKLILDSYIAIVSKFSEDKRASLIKSLVNYRGNSATETVENIKVIIASLSNFSADKTDFVNLLINFGSKNPTEGRKFISYTNKIMPNFISEYRLDVLKTLINSFYNYFNNRVNQQIEITDIFLKNLNTYKSEQYTKALETYYGLMVEKNYQRQRKIQEIDDEYSYVLAGAEAKYEMAQIEKVALRMNGLYLAGGAISFIAILALIL
ncbi:MAG: hypothetical protein Q8M94_11235, partial [Ignavibacteria bacterium]|nr:hypothetical protein [Ignavibacteria bacterium]